MLVALNMACLVAYFLLYFLFIARAMTNLKHLPYNSMRMANQTVRLQVRPPIQALVAEGWVMRDRQRWLLDHICCRGLAPHRPASRCAALPSADPAAQPPNHFFPAVRHHLHLR